MRPSEAYQRQLASGQYQHDPIQERAIKELDRVSDELQRPRRGLLVRWRGLPKVRGVYLYGGVGRGKTWLMDLFFETLDGVSKRRVHFHRFMEDVHDRLRARASERDPLRAVGLELAAQARVLCFDEFFVVDIADAMILAELLDTMLGAGVTLVTTSNAHPDDLYRDGLQRAKFLPTIDLLKKHCALLSVNGDTDYRLRFLRSAEIYHCPLDASAREVLDAAMSRLAPGEIATDRAIHINHREMQTIALSDGIAWMSFDVLCQSPRAPADYIELGRRFNTILIDAVPAMDDHDNDAARRFIHLIDELYDRRVNVVITAACPPDSLYRGERLAFEFDRTVSRLIEMQSEAYLAEEHRA